MPRFSTSTRRQFATLCNRPSACRKNEESAYRPWIGATAAETLLRAATFRKTKAVRYTGLSAGTGSMLFAMDLIEPLPILGWTLTLGVPLFHAFGYYRYRQLAAKAEGEAVWNTHDRQTFQDAILDGWCSKQDKSQLPCYLGGTQCSQQ